MSNLTKLSAFITNSQYTTASDLYRASDRTEVNGRLLHWAKKLESFGLSKNRSALITAALGELCNNAFDHNLGQWHKEVGCLVLLERLKDRVRIGVADQGQGIAASLRRVCPETTENTDLLKIAFESRISGRSPERRGNGLKFVSKQFKDQGGLSLVCLSSDATYSIGQDHQLLTGLSKPISIGTLIAIDWSLS